MLSSQSSPADQDLGTSFNTCSNSLCDSPESPEFLQEAEFLREDCVVSDSASSSKGSKYLAKKTLDFEGLTGSQYEPTLTATQSKKVKYNWYYIPAKINWPATMCPSIVS
jgi:hypothetical protein